jgi:septum formation protein
LIRPPLVLASGSRYRAELLQRLGWPFVVSVAGTDETPLCGETPAATALRLAAAKARAVADKHPASLIIGSDQVADLDGRPIGKPGSRENARLQLTEASGRTIDFHTGIALLDTASGHLASRLVTTQVRYRPLTPAMIEAYLDREPALDCAGSAKSEGLGIALLAEMQTPDATALIGLPLIALCELLADAGHPVLP